MIVGLDMGGTNVDAVIIKQRKIIKTAKHPIDQADLFASIWTTLEKLLADIDITAIRQINLSTTVSTNAIVEEKTSPVAMFIQSGPGVPHEFLAKGEKNFFLSGYIDHRGRVVKKMDPQEIKERLNQLKQENIQDFGIVTKFSTRNPEVERRIKDILTPHSFSSITMGHTLSGKLNFPRRVNTTYLNAAVSQTFHRFSTHMKKALDEMGLSNIPIHVLKADGGTMQISHAEKLPVETILSGPAASLMGIHTMFASEKDALLLDMGGTTTDIFFLLEGVPLFEPLGIQMGAFPTLIRSIYSQSIGLGGDSSIDIIDGDLIIGPERKGKPLAFGGPVPTPTDAMIVCGLYSEGDYDKAFAGIKSLGDTLGLSANKMATIIMEEMATTIQKKVSALLAEINSQPVYTVREVLENRQVKPEEIQIIGGPAKALTPLLASAFNIPCKYPEHYQVANAVGAALAKITTEVTLEADTTQKIVSIPELDIYEKISRNFSLADARERTLTSLKELAVQLGATESEIQAEITEESSFPMVRGFSTSGENIRVKAQIKPGFIHKLEGIDHHVTSKE